jgi:tetratricopeptide (TPR) repeat protein
MSASAVKTRQPPPAVPDWMRPYLDENHPKYSHYPRGRMFSWLRWLLVALWGLIGYYFAYVVSTLFPTAVSDPTQLRDPTVILRAFPLPPGIINGAQPLWVYGASGVVFVAVLAVSFMATRDLRREHDIVETRRLRSHIEEHLPKIGSGAGAKASESPADAAPQGPPFEEALLTPPSRFVGRAQDLDWLLEALRVGGATAVTAVNGMGGIGKTALAGEAVKRLRAEGRFRDGVAVVIAIGMTDAAEVLRTVLARFDSRRRAPEVADLAGLATVAHQLLDGKDALIVLDNVEPGLAIGQVVAPLRATGVTLLLTARETLPAGVADASRRLELMVEQDAVDLFAFYYGRGDAQDLTRDERAVVERIVAELGRHTLAVKLAAAYAREQSSDLPTLARELAEPAQALDVLSESDAPEAVKDSFARSYRTLPEPGQRLFPALAAFATNEMGRDAVVGLAQGLGLAEENANLLVRRALLEASVDEGMPQESDRQRRKLHPLLRAFAQTLFAAWSDDGQANARRAVATYYAEYANQTEDLALSTDETNIVGALEWAHEHGEDELAADLCSGLQYFWRDTGRTKAALAYLPWGVEAAEHIAVATKERDDRLRASQLSLTYGVILQGVGRLPEAEEAYKRNLTIRRELGDRRGEGIVLSLLGRIALQRGHLDEAERYFQQALAIDREARVRWDEGIDISSLGQIALTRGHLEEAEQYFQQGLAIDRAVQNRSEEGSVLAWLGQLAKDRGHLEEAAEYFQQSLVIARDVQDRQGEGAVLSNLGQIAQRRGRLEEAAEYFQQSLVIRREVQDRRGEGVVLAQLGVIARARERFEEAEQRFREGLAILDEVQDAPNVAGVALSLGDLLIEHRNRREEGCALIQQAIRTRHELGLPGEEEARERARRLGCGEP